MVPVDQTIFEDGHGDCLRACVASILELPIAILPNFAERGYYAGVAEFLATLGLSLLEISWSGDGYAHEQYLSCLPVIHCIVGGWSPRGNDGSGKRKQHAVVGHVAGWQVIVDHDPHPSRAGIVGEPLHLVWIVKAPA